MRIVGMDAAEVAGGTFNREQLFAIIIANGLSRGLSAITLPTSASTWWAVVSAATSLDSNSVINFPQFVSCRRMLVLDRVKFRTHSRYSAALCSFCSLLCSCGNASRKRRAK